MDALSIAVKTVDLYSVWFRAMYNGELVSCPSWNAIRIHWTLCDDGSLYTEPELNVGACFELTRMQER